MSWIIGKYVLLCVNSTSFTSRYRCDACERGLNNWYGNPTNQRRHLESAGHLRAVERLQRKNELAGLPKELRPKQKKQGTLRAFMVANTKKKVT